MRSFAPILLLPPLLLLCVTLPHLNDGEFRRDTKRYASVGMYLYESGDLLAPQLRPGVPYFNKPPLALWIHGASMKLGGGELAAARLPSVLAAAALVLLSILCARQLGGRNEALISGFLLVLSYEFTRRTREISLDLWMLLWILAAAYLIIREARVSSRWRPLAAGALLGLALMTKPLIALGAPLLFWACFFRGARPKRAASMLAWQYAGAVAVAAPWHLYMWNRFGTAFTDQYFGNQIVERAQGAHGNEGIFYYFGISEWIWLPWILAALGVWVWRNRLPRRTRQPGLFQAGWIWALGWLLALSLFADKKPNYLLPVWPALSWVGAYALARLRVPGLTKWHRCGYRWLAPAALAAAATVAVLPFKAQQGKPSDLDVILPELERRGIAITELAARSLDDDDYSYIHLKTGRWPLSDLGSATHLLTRRPSQRDATLVFKHGRYHLWEFTRKAKILESTESPPPTR